MGLVLGWKVFGFGIVYVVFYVWIIYSKKFI